jgi:stage II sporulation protein D
MNRRKRVALILILPAMMISVSARAGETIRVGLLPDVASVTVSGSPDLVLTSPDGGIVAQGLKLPVQIVPGPRGLTVQGEPTDLQEVIAHSPDGNLRLNDQVFGGTLHVALIRDRLRLINELDVEEYLKGVVPLEISPAWRPEALKVQAIIARTYALHQKQANLGREYDLLATTADQVYGGRTVEKPAATQAVMETQDLVLTYDGTLILSAYHSTSAGPTENGSEVWGIDLPYLRGVSCPFDQNSPYYEWDRSFPMDTVQESLAKAGYDIGTIASITPYRWTDAGRISRLRLLHSRGELILRAEDLRRVLGYRELPSTHFKIEKIGRDMQVQGNGYGHGVGLCQWGAKEMAEMGYGYEKILKYYYPGVRVEPYASLTTAGTQP